MRVIILIFFLINAPCIINAQPITKDANSIKEDTIIPIISSDFEGGSKPLIFEAAYYNKTNVKQGDLLYNFDVLDIGKIRIVSGKIIVCDPIVMNNRKAYIQEFPIGKFPVQLALAKTNNDSRVAFSRILFSNNQVAKWEFALQTGQEHVDIYDSTFYCFSVDAGLAIFIDEKTNRIFNKRYENSWNAVFVNKAIKNRFGFMHSFDKQDFATFSTGYGDGCYAAYIGYDENGDICRLLADFALVEWWKLKNKD